MRGKRFLRLLVGMQSGIENPAVPISSGFDRKEQYFFCIRSLNRFKRQLAKKKIPGPSPGKPTPQ